MKSHRKWYLSGATVVIILVSTLIYQNCGGTHERSTVFSITTAQAEQNLASLQCAISGSTTSDEDLSTAVNSASNLLNSQESLFYYTQAPSSMGDLNLVAPLDYADMRTDGGGMPQQIYAFFIIGADGTGSLVVAVSDSSGTTSTVSGAATPVVATALAAKVAHGKTLSFNTAHQLDASSPSSSCNSSNPLNLTTAISAYNDGTLGLEPASFDGDIFEMELSMDGGTTLRVRSYDVEDGELQDTIQLEVNAVDPNSGQEIYVGDINFTTPD